MIDVNGGLGLSDAGTDTEALAHAVMSVRPHEHLCLIYETQPERLAAVKQFFMSGLEQGHRCLYLADAPTTNIAVEALRHEGLKTTSALDSGALLTLADRTAFTTDGSLDPGGLLAFIAASTNAAKAAGFPALRVAGEMLWVLGEHRDGALIELEVKLHEFLPKHECLAIFHYDQSALPAEVIRDVILTHPVVIHGCNLYRNARALPPSQFLGRDRTAREVDRLLDVLADQKVLLDRVEQHARRQEALHDTVVSALHEGVILQEASGRILTWNPAAERIIGISAEEALGETSISRDWRLALEDGTPLAGENHPSMRTLATGEACTDLIMNLTRPDGERRWVSVNTEPVWEDHAGARHVAAVVISFDDVTEARRQDEARHAVEALLRGVFDVMPSGCAIYQVRGDGSSGDDYIVRFFNAAALAMESKTHDEVVGRSLRDLRPTIDEYGLIPIFQRVWRTGEPARYPATIYVDEQYANYYENHVFRLPNGEIVSIYDDVTERETAIRSLRENEEMWRSYVETAPYGVFVTDATGRYLQVNPEACRTTGYEESELLAMSIADTVPPESREAGLRHFERLLATGRSTGEIPFITKSGERRWWSISAVGLPGDRYLGFTADFTDRVLAEAELAELNVSLDRRVQERTAELEAANAELEAFSYSVSHDLRAPLRHVSGFAHLLREATGDALNDEQRHCFARIDAAVATMGHLIDDLIEFSRIGRSDIKRSMVDMERVAAEAIEAVRPDEPSREIEWLVSALPRALADESIMRLVWINLLDNAVKYTSPHPRARVEIGGREEAEEAVYWVRDDGVGFDPAYTDKLFGVFQRLHRNEEFDGTGIGLATVSRVITRLGGRVWAEGALEGGATFFFALPRSEG